MDFVQVTRHPGKQALEEAVEAHPTEAHCPYGTIFKEVEVAARQHAGLAAVFEPVRRFDVGRFGSQTAATENDVATTGGLTQRFRFPQTVSESGHFAGLSSKR